MGPVQHADTAKRTMLAITQQGYGSAEVLRMTRIPWPEIADTEVLLRVHAAGVDRGAWHFMTGRPYLMRLAVGLRSPKNPVLGREVAGTVVAVGAAVTRFVEGDEVFGIARGAFAEYAAAREGKLARKPATLSFEQAAVVSVSALTALQAVTDIGHVRHGQQVLVLGASGGVGTYAVQLAKAAGAKVTGVCSADKVALVRSLGADHVLDYARDDFADGRRHYDLILDIAGNPSPGRLRRALTQTGLAIIVGGEEGGRLTGGLDRQLRALVLARFVSQRLTGMLCQERGADLERLAELIEAGKVTPSLDRIYPLAQVPDALRHLAEGKARGKIAIAI